MVPNIDIRESRSLSVVDKTTFIKIHNDIFIKTINSEFLDEINKNKILRYFTAYNNDKIIGNILIYAEETKNGDLVGKIENLFVIAEWRKCNIARYLMNQAMDYFNKNNIKSIQLEVWNANKTAYYFYENLGFRFKEEIELYPGIYL